MGVPVTGVIVSAVGDLWQLTISRSSYVSISLSADNSELDSYLVLYDPQFQLVEEHDDIEQGIIQDSVLNQILLSKPGRYWILAGRCCPEEDGGSEGDYRLEVEVEVEAKR